MTSRTEKSWGMSERLFCDHRVQLERVVILPTGYSSIHFHRHKRNLFQIETGTLRVREFVARDGGYFEVTAVHEIGQGQTLEIPPLRWHQFEALDEVVHGHELYYPFLSGDVVLADDIERATEGGIQEEAAFHLRHSTAAWRGVCCFCDGQLTPNNPGFPVVAQYAARICCEACAKRMEYETKEVRVYGDA